jgi:hypothetical protein
MTKKKLSNVICYFCQKPGHLICPLKKTNFVVEDYYSDQVMLTDSDKELQGESTSKVEKMLKKKRKRVLTNVATRDIISTKFCPKCADTHSIKKCKVKLRENTFDALRLSYSKQVFREKEDYGNKRYY